MSATSKTPRTDKAWADMSTTPCDLRRVSEQLETEVNAANERWAILKGWLVTNGKWDLYAVVERIEKEIKP